MKRLSVDASGGAFAVDAKRKPGEESRWEADRNTNTNTNTDATAVVVVLSRSRVQRLMVTAALSAAVVMAIVGFGPLIGMSIPRAPLLILACGAVLMELFPTRPLEAASVIGLVTLAATNKVYAAYHLILVLALFCARRRAISLIAVLGCLAIALPKHLFYAHHHHPGFYNWINEPSLALTLFVTARWWRERRDGRLADGAERAPLMAFAALYFFPGHAANPIVYGASDLFRERRVDVRGVLVALLLLGSKAIGHTVIARLFPWASYGALDSARAEASSIARLWGIVLVNYLDLALMLSGTADLAVMIARLYGWPMPSPFRWALLAWNPVELWRRWGLYNRRFLLAVVYFPLGGGRRHPYLNVMLTFLASALLMHSGWFGSKYWQVGVAGWRDESIYFLLQGAAVCACMFWRRTTESGEVSPRMDRALRWSWRRFAGTLATQATSALIHVVILAQAMPLAARFRVIGRCVGLLRR